MVISLCYGPYPLTNLYLFETFYGAEAFFFKFFYLQKGFFIQ